MAAAIDAWYLYNVRRYVANHKKMKAHPYYYNLFSSFMCKIYFLDKEIGGSELKFFAEHIWNPDPMAGSFLGGADRAADTAGVRRGRAGPPGV